MPYFLLNFIQASGVRSMPVLWGFSLFEYQEQGRVKVLGWQRWCMPEAVKPSGTRNWQGDGPVPAETQNLLPLCGSVTTSLPSPFLPHHNALNQPEKLFSSDGAHEITSVLSIRSQAINNQPFKISSPVSLRVGSGITGSAAEQWERIRALACCWQPEPGDLEHEAGASACTT